MKFVNKHKRAVMDCCPALKCELSTPKVIWYQTDGSVILRIMLPDVDDYFLLIDQDHLRFSTITKDRPYYLCLYLFGAIIPEKSTHSNVQREIRVNLPKAHRFVPWMRLCLERRSDPQIIADPDKMEVEQFVVKKIIERDWKDWEEYKREHQIFNVPPPPSSSDEEESDDEMMDALIDEM